MEITLGVVPDLGAAPIIMAIERGLFEKHGVSPSIRILETTDEVRRQLVAGELDAGMLYPGEALLPREKVDLTISSILVRNAGAVSVPPSLWTSMQPYLLREAGGEAVHPIHADTLRQLAQESDRAEIPIHFQIEAPLDTNTLTLGYWLGAGGIFPDIGPLPPPSPSPGEPPFDKHNRVVLSKQPPPGITKGLSSSLWHRPADHIVLVSNEAIVKDLPSSVLASLATWNQANRETLVSCVAALIEAGQWLDASMENRRTAATELAQVLGGPVGAPSTPPANPLNFDLTSANSVTFADNGSATPDRPSSLWILSQMARWGHLPPTTTDEAFESLVDQTLEQDLFVDAVKKTEAFLPGIRLRLDRDAIIDQVIDGNRLLPQQTAAYVSGFKIKLP